MVDQHRSVRAVEHLIGAHLGRHFGDVVITGHAIFHVTPKSDLSFDSDEADDLLEAVELGLRRRRFGKAVRIEIGPVAALALPNCMRELHLSPSAAVTHCGPLGMSGLHQLANVDLPEHHFPVHMPRVPSWLPGPSGGSIFDATVVEFVHAAAADPATRSNQDGVVSHVTRRRRH